MFGIIKSLQSLKISSLSQCSTVLLKNAAPSSSALMMTMTVRTKVTKTKKHRILKKAQQDNNPNYKKPLPPKFIPVDEPIIIAPSASRRSLAQQTPEKDKLTTLLPQRSAELSEATPPLRYQFTSLKSEMEENHSPKLLKLLQLSNASSSEMHSVQKQKAMELFQIRPGDSGSSPVQIMALTSRIQQMQKHIGMHKKDYSGKRGLDAMYVRRRKLLDYLERKDYETYGVVVKALNLVR